jgi:type IV fimbrial biogenesis protein FimT
MAAKHVRVLIRVSAGNKSVFKLNKTRFHGFTLIELMVVVLIVGIISVFAAPSFIAFQRSVELKTTANDFHSAVNLARAEALKSGVTTFVQPRQSDDWSTGWIVYVDRDFNNSFDSTTDTLVLTSDPIPKFTTVDITATGQAFFDSNTSVRYVSFAGTGYPRTIGSGGFLANRIIFSNEAGKRTVIVSSTGRARVCVTGTTNCTSSTAQ